MEFLWYIVCHMCAHTIYHPNIFFSTKRIFFIYLKYLRTSDTFFCYFKKELSEIFFWNFSKLNIFVPDVPKYFKYFLRLLSTIKTYFFCTTPSYFLLLPKVKSKTSYPEKKFVFEYSQKQCFCAWCVQIIFFHIYWYLLCGSI